MTTQNACKTSARNDTNTYLGDGRDTWPESCATTGEEMSGDRARARRRRRRLGRCVGAAPCGAVRCGAVPRSPGCGNSRLQRAVRVLSAARWGVGGGGRREVGGSEEGARMGSARSHTVRARAYIAPTICAACPAVWSVG